MDSLLDALPSVPAQRAPQSEAGAARADLMSGLTGLELDQDGAAPGRPAAPSASAALSRRRAAEDAEARATQARQRAAAAEARLKAAHAAGAELVGQALASDAAASASADGGRSKKQGRRQKKKKARGADYEDKLGVRAGRADVRARRRARAKRMY